jgi:hypothetical protein
MQDRYFEKAIKFFDMAKKEFERDIKVAQSGAKGRLQ